MYQRDIPSDIIGVNQLQNKNESQLAVASGISGASRIVP